VACTIVMKTPSTRAAISTVRTAAALGAALRAYHGDCLASGRPVEWPEVVAGFTDPAPGEPIRPRAAHVAVYGRTLQEYGRFESLILSPASPKQD